MTDTHLWHQKAWRNAVFTIGLIYGIQLIMDTWPKVHVKESCHGNEDTQKDRSYRAW